MIAGDCFWAVTEVYRDGKENGHLFFILLDPVGNPPKSVIVPCCTIREHYHDPTYLLGPSDHGFINLPSYADYHFADIVPIGWISAEIGSGGARMKDRVSAGVLAKLQQGLLDSPHTRNRVKAWYREKVGS